MQPNGKELDLGPLPKITFEGCIERNHCSEVPPKVGLWGCLRVFSASWKRFGQCWERLGRVIEGRGWILGGAKPHLGAILDLLMSILATQQQRIGFGTLPKVTFEGCIERNHCSREAGQIGHRGEGVRPANQLRGGRHRGGQRQPHTPLHPFQGSADLISRILPRGIIFEGAELL